MRPPDIEMRALEIDPNFTATILWATILGRNSNEELRRGQFSMVVRQTRDARAFRDCFARRHSDYPIEIVIPSGLE
jgi:hypothetical protein